MLTAERRATILQQEKDDLMANMEQVLYPRGLLYYMHN